MIGGGGSKNRSLGQTPKTETLLLRDWGHDLYEHCVDIATFCSGFKGHVKSIKIQDFYIIVRRRSRSVVRSNRTLKSLNKSVHDELYLCLKLK